jgi:DNA primase
MPFHEGDKRTASFSGHLEKGIFQCFGCGAKGNVLDFAVLMDGGDTKKGLDVRKTALKLSNALNLHSSGLSNRESGIQTEGRRGTDKAPMCDNPPLGFRLKYLQADHIYLQNRGFTREVMEHFGVGFCSKGIFAGRIVIPLHRADGELVGYAGRVVDDATCSPENPKYLFPSKRESNGQVVRFRKSAFLYNGYRLKEPVSDLILVEGFASVWWLTQCGWPNVVALMGSSFSEEQLCLISQVTSAKGTLWIMTDGDTAGIRCGSQLSEALGKSRLCCKVIKEGFQPTDYSSEELNELLGS